MLKNMLRSKFLIVAIMGLSFLGLYSTAFARGEGGHDSHYYHNGGWHRNGWFGLDIAVAALTIGAVVEALPFGSKTVIVSGEPYYYYDGYYYRHYPYGYEVVPVPVAAPRVVYAPSVVQSSGTMLGETIIINVPNVNGSYTPVTLVKKNSGYLGPQGEYYEGHPSVKQLEALYGR